MKSDILLLIYNLLAGQRLLLLHSNILGLMTKYIARLNNFKQSKILVPTTIIVYAAIN